MAVATSTALLAAGVAGAGATAYAANQASKAGGGTPAPRDLYDEGTDTLRAQIDLAGPRFAAEQEYAPQYAQLYQDLLNQSYFGEGGLMNLYGRATPQFGQIQAGANTQQRQADITDVQNLGGQAVDAFRAANPQLTSITNAMTNRALGAQGPMSALTPQAGVGFNNVRAGQNQGTQALMSSALGQLAQGGSLSQTETRDITNDVLQRYNRGGRANDRAAVAEMALGLDGAQQARLAQRQGMVANAAGLQGQQIGQNLQGDLANMGAGLQAGSFNADMNFRTGLANQEAQLRNAGYIDSLMGQAGSFLSANQMDPFQAILGRSGSLGNSMGAYGQAGAASAYGGTGMFNPFDPYAADLNSTNFNAASANNIAGRNNSSALLGSGLGFLGQLGGAYLGRG